MKTNKSYNWLISEKQAEKLRQLGFDENNEQMVKLFEKSTNLIIEPSLEIFETTYYKDYLKNPDKYIPLYTYEQVFEWFREKGFYSYIMRKSYPERYIYYIDYGLINYSEKNLKDSLLPKKYEEARDSVLNKLIELYGNSI